MRHWPCSPGALLTVVVLLWGASTASAAPTLDGVYRLSGAPAQATTSPDGTAWFILSGSSDGKELAAVSPSGAVTEYDVEASSLADLIAVNAGGGPRIWFSGIAGGSPGLIEFDPATRTTTPHRVDGLTDPRGITYGTSGSLSFWIGDGGGAGIFEVTATGAKTTRTPNPVVDNPPGTVVGNARGLTTGVDGKIWWADFSNRAIRSMSTFSSNAAVTSSAVGDGPQEVLAGRPGEIAFTSPTGAVGRIRNGVVTPVNVPGTEPYGIAYGNDGAYYFAQFAASKLLRMAADGSLSDVPLPGQPRYLTGSVDGKTLYVGLENTHQIARIVGVEPPPANANPQGPPSSNRQPSGNTQLVTDLAAPVLSGLTMTNRRFKVGRGSTAISAATRIGTTFRFSVTEAGTASLVIARIDAGRRKGRSCVKPTAKLRKAAKCTRYVTVGTLKRKVAAGVNRVAFTGRIGTKPLKAARYRLAVTSVDAAGNRSGASRTTFTVVKK